MWLMNKYYFIYIRLLRSPRVIEHIFFSYKAVLSLEILDQYIQRIFDQNILFSEIWFRSNL